MAGGRKDRESAPARSDGGDEVFDPREIERAYARGTLKNRRMTKALDTIAREMERDPASLARTLRRWLNEG